MSILQKIWSQPNRLGNLFSLLRGVILHRGAIFPGPYLKLVKRGKIVTNGGKVFLGFLSNQVGLSPGTRGIVRISNSGVLETYGTVRIAQGYTARQTLWCALWAVV